METRLASKYCITSRFSRVLMAGNIGTFTNLIKKGKGSCFKHIVASRDALRDSQKRQMQLEKRKKVGNLGKL